jgi:hypothetical protein
MSQPLLPAVWAIFFIFGFVMSLKEVIATCYRYFKYHFQKGLEKVIPQKSKWFYPALLAQSTFWVMLVPGVLSIEGIPHSLRIIGTIPAVFLMTVFPIEYVFKKFMFYKNASDRNAIRMKYLLLATLVLCVALVALGGMIGIRTYFGPWANDMRTEAAYERKLYLLGDLVHQLPVHRNNYIVTAINTFISVDSRQSSLRTVEYMGYPKIKNYLYYHPLDGFNAISCDDPQIIFMDSDQWLRDQYRNACPGLVTKRYDFDGKKYTFFVLSNDQ